jgi:hypothetical protein
MGRSTSLRTLFHGLFRGNTLNEALVGNIIIRTLMDQLNIDPNSISRTNISSLLPSDEIMRLVLEILLSQ